jgi:putative DNA primase/helicase
MNAAEEFRAAMAAAGLTPPDEIVGDGQRHRFGTNGKRGDDSGWYRLHLDERPAGAFGCWRSGVSETWKASTRREFAAEEKRAWAERMATLKAAREAERREAHDRAAAKASSMWDAARDASEAHHDYLQRKRIPGIGARLLRDQLLVPMRHGPGDLVGLQVIQPDGSRKFLTGTPAEGAYTTIGRPSRTGQIVICEGYATGVSIHQATGWCVVVAFQAGNLAAVATKIRAALPDAQVCIGADEDEGSLEKRIQTQVELGARFVAWTSVAGGFKAAAMEKAGRQIIVGNPGIEAAAATGLPVALPLWAGDRGRGTDFNDLHVDEGLDAVRVCFEDPKPIDEPPRSEGSDKPVSVGGPGGPNNPGSSGTGSRHPSDGPTAVVEPPPAPQGADTPEPAAGSDVTTAGSAAEILPAVSDELAPNCSEDDLAARHLQRMRQLTLWCEMWGRWLTWNGDRWLKDETLAVQDQVRQTMREIANQVLQDPELKPDKRQRQADRIASYKTIQNVERMARTYRHVATHPDEWDADLWALNTPGGVVDLRTGATTPHAVGDRFTKITAVAPGGGCPTWLQFLDRATGGDVQLQGFLKRMCGYALTGEVREHALFFVYGTGGNGKGTFLTTITHIMGDYQRVSGAETFTESPGDRHTTELARLQGARLVTAQETEEGKRWAESRIKALTGGDPITARFMRQDDFTYVPQFKLVIVGNHKPAFRNVDEAIRRRLHLIPFTASIPASERDPMLPVKLKAEAGGILAWMIEGCREWATHGLQPPAVVKESTDQYLGAEDSLQQWLDECCDLVPGFTTSQALFGNWQAWCEQSGEYVGTMKRLMSKLESRGILTGQRMGRSRGCSGIRIKNDDSNPY